VLTLEPGDVIVMGTPAGVGQARTPPVWMKAGDTIEIDIERVGLLSNPIVQEPK
jgi:2-keto-4-pentenoate hydratase/2-oxohepta-3-ene-1,7-dioic acid hydratase in catechol pathway